MRFHAKAERFSLIPRLAILFLAMAPALSLPMRGSAQADHKTNSASGEETDTRANVGDAAQPASVQADEPAANPGRPTVSTPATLTPKGYLQFETGILAAWRSPEFSSQTSLVEVVKFAPWRRIELLAASGPFVHSDTHPKTGTGDQSLGVQGVVRQGINARPTVALSYFRRVLDGGTPDLDMGSAGNSIILLGSADVKGFHYDTNYMLNEVESDEKVRRAQFGETLSLSHGLAGKFGVSGELWNFSQPFLRSHALGNLWAVNYNARKTLVLDLALDHGFTTTSTRWEVLGGFTYLLPRELKLHRRSAQGKSLQEK
jgi:hypothetical protein